MYLLLLNVKYYQYYHIINASLNIVIYREISLTPLQADDTSCSFSHDWAELAGVLDTGNTVTRARDKRLENILIVL